MTIYIIAILTLLILFIFFSVELPRLENRIHHQFKKFFFDSPQKFLDMRNKFLKNDEDGIFKNNFTGVYIIYNKNKKMYYVGQAIRILDRVNNHFTGHGNGDVYADYKYGDKFTIELKPFKKNHKFKDLNAFEKYYIHRFNAYDNGYNKTKGNN